MADTNVQKLAQQILASSDSTKWQGEGFGSAQANAEDMAKILSSAGITDISQFGALPIYQKLDAQYVYQGQPVTQNKDGSFVAMVPYGDGYVQAVPVPASAVSVQYGLKTAIDDSGNFVFTPIDPSKITTQDGQVVGQTGVTYGNIETGQKLGNTYGERQIDNAWGGTYAGKGNTAYRVQFDDQGKPQFYTTGASSSDIGTIAPILAGVSMALGVPGLLGSALNSGLGLGLGAAGQAALGGATFGAGMAGITGGDVLTGAVLGGAGGYVQGSGGIGNVLGNTSTDFFPIGGTTGTTLTPAAIESGLGTAGYGINAGASTSGLFNPALVGLNATAGSQTLNTGSSLYDLSPSVTSNLSSMNGGTGLTSTNAANLSDMGGAQGLTITNAAPSTTLQNALDTFGGTPTNLSSMNGGTGLTLNTEYPSQNVVSQGGVNTGFNVGNYLNSTVGGNLGTTLNNINTGINSSSVPSTPSTNNLNASDVLKLAATAGGLLGGAALVNNTPAGSNVIPSQGVPTQNSDYYKAIQQYYNAYMPNAPRDVAGPLEQWYNNSYGKAAVPVSTVVTNNVPVSATAPAATPTYKTTVPASVSGLLNTASLAQASSADKANIYNTMLNSGMSDAAIRQAVTERVGTQENNAWNYLQGLGAAQALQGASITPQTVQNIKNLEPVDKAIAYNSLINSGLTDSQIRNLVENKIGSQTNTDWQYLQNLSNAVSSINNPGLLSSSPAAKAQLYNTLLDSGLSDSAIRQVAEGTVGTQTDSDWKYLTQLAGIQKVKAGTALDKAQAYNEMLATGMNDADVRNLVEQAVGSQTDADWQYLKQLASSI